MSITSNEEEKKKSLNYDINFDIKNYNIKDEKLNTKISNDY